MSSFFNFLVYIGIQLINNIVLVSGVQQSDSVIRIHVSILFQVLFSFRLLQNTEQSSLCYTVGLCWLPILNIAVCTCQSHPLKLSSETHPCVNQGYRLTLPTWHGRWPTTALVLCVFYLQSKKRDFSASNMENSRKDLDWTSLGPKPFPWTCLCLL